MATGLTPPCGIFYSQNVKLNNTPDQLLVANNYLKATFVVDANFFKKVTVRILAGTLLRISCESQKRAVCPT
jgi:hypothetical protein